MSDRALSLEALPTPATQEIRSAELIRHYRVNIATPTT